MIAELDRVIREIQSALEVIEADDALYGEASFGHRLEALDSIEVSVVERMEGLLAANRQAEALLSLQQRAKEVKSRLEAVDEKLCRELRSNIRSGNYRGTELRNRLEAYAGCRRGEGSQDDGFYDSLDALLSGILLAEAAPGEAKGWESEMVFYQPTPARIIFELADRAALQKNDTFYDLGSGLGQVVILVHLLSGAPAKGVEVNQTYCDYARQRAQALNLPGVDFVHADARKADYSDGVAFYLYTPFEGKMLQEVLEKLKGEADTRTIRIYTYGPCTLNVSRQDWLEPLGPRAHHVDRLAGFRSVRRHG